MLNIGHGSTKRQKPRKAFETVRENYSQRLDFGDSSIPSGNVYRRRWAAKKSLISIIIRLLILFFILFIIVGLIFGL